MALDIGIGDGVSHIPQEHEPWLQLHDDGYYWFLQPLFETLRAETGQFIDLYGEAWFDGPQLTVLASLIERAIEQVRAQPAFWRVQTGTQIQPEFRDLFAEVRQDRFLDLLEQWRAVVGRAQATGRPVVCWGD